MEIDLSIVAAMTCSGVIGTNGGLPWEEAGKKVVSDLIRFRDITKEARIMLMGYKTYISILSRNKAPLSERKHIVLTRKKKGCLPSSRESVQFVGSVEEALTAVAANGGRACVIGGGEVFRIFLPMPEVKKVYLTKVHAELRGDTVFPVLVPTADAHWICTDISDVRKWNPNDEYPTSFETYERFKSLF